MTPFELEILLHCYYSPSPPPIAKTDAPIFHGTIAALVETGLLKERKAGFPGSFEYVATDRCNAYIKAVLAVPLPVQQWVMPTLKWGDIIDIGCVDCGGKAGVHHPACSLRAPSTHAP